MDISVGAVSTSRPGGREVYLIVIWEIRNNLCMEYYIEGNNCYVVLSYIGTLMFYNNYIGNDI